VVAGDRQMWVYRTDESGKVAKLDEGSTQAIADNEDDDNEG
jgi:hypothetical protein